MTVCEICGKETAHGTLIHEYHEGGVLAWQAACCDCGGEADRISKINYSKYGNMIRYSYFDDRFICSSKCERFEEYREKAMWGD